MKRLIPLLLVFVLLLAGCVTEDTVHEPVETVADGQKIVVLYDVGSTDSGTVTLESGKVYSFEKIKVRSMDYRYTYLGKLTGETDANGDPVLEPASPYEKTLAPNIGQKDLSLAIYSARPLHLPDSWLMLVLSLGLIAAGVGTFFMHKGVVTMFSSPKGLTPLAVKELVQPTSQGGKNGSVFFKVLGVVIAVCGVILLIFTLL